MERTDLKLALDAFGAELGPLLDAVGTPSSENSIVHCLALGLRAALGAKAKVIDFEHPDGHGGRIDLVLLPALLAIEAKYFREEVRNSKAITAIYGNLLADFRALKEQPFLNKLVVLLCDARFVKYIKKQVQVLPWQVGQNPTHLKSAGFTFLPDTARTNASTRGSWNEPTADLVWRWEHGRWTSFAWIVT